MMTKRADAAREMRQKKIEAIQSGEYKTSIMLQPRQRHIATQLLFAHCRVDAPPSLDILPGAVWLNGDENND